MRMHTFRGVRDGYRYIIDFTNDGHVWVIDVYWGESCCYTRYMDAYLSLKEVFDEMSEEFPDMEWSEQ